MQGTLFSSKNLKLFGISLALLAVGYVLLGQGPVDNPLSKTVAPIILVAVYCVLIPYAIMAKSKGPSDGKDGRQQKKP
jgi:ABC-type Fe3+ transport system permease subunit